MAVTVPVKYRYSSSFPVDGYTVPTKISVPDDEYFGSDTATVADELSDMNRRRLDVEAGSSASFR